MALQGERESELRQRPVASVTLEGSTSNGAGTGSRRNQDEDAQQGGTVEAKLGLEGEEDGKKQETVYGRTPDGKVFPIPRTHNVLTGLFDPRIPKSTLDVITLTLLAAQVVLWLCLPLQTSKYFFMVSFAIWRLAYNAGLGYVLAKQSKRRWIVNSFKKNGWLDGSKHPHIKKWIKSQVTTKMGKDYDFDSYPAEYNVWVLFRHSVDIILLNDFLSYFLCGISFMTWPKQDGKSILLYVLRWAAGITLLVFNLWVKTDAHRIITDLAWYWADAFFLSLQNLVFDGVFEMAPHPMYSVGYAGYYGLSLIVGSETVLFVSLAAHACQFAFLVFFENPHIERTYGERKPIAMRTPLRQDYSIDSSSATGTKSGDARQPRRASSTTSMEPARNLFTDTPAGSDASDADDTDTDVASHAYRHKRSASDASSADLDAEDEERRRAYGSRLSSRRQSIHDPPRLQSRHDLDNYYFRHDTVIFQNLDLLRSADLSFVLSILYLGSAFILPYLSANQQIAAFAVNALAWRVVHTFVLGNVLKAQSEKKWMVRHFLKHYHYEEVGFGATEEAFNNWKGIYNISLCMVYASFGLLALKCYDWSLTTETLRHTLGLLLIAVHIWTAKAIYDVLGRFGWFYGDFFIQGEGAPLQLYYTGIYRHVNNPERIMGGAAFFGLALLSGSKLVGAIAIISVLSHFWFLSCVEGPHMKRLYGNTVRKEAGVTKTFRVAANKNSHRAPPQVKRAVQEFQGTLERVFDDTAEAVEEFLRRSAPKLNDYVQNTKVLLKEQGERLLITRVSDVAALDTSAYSVTLRPSELNGDIGDSSLPDLPQASKPMPQYQLGENINVKWTAASNCSRKDWIGLYRYGANKSKLVTRIRSQGRWLGIYPDEWDGDTSLAVEGASGSQGADGPVKHGSLSFGGKKLFWKPGQYEFRYHHDGKHSVMAVSEPFEIVAEKPSNLQSYKSVYGTLLPLVTRCLDNDPQLVPETAIPLLPESARPSEEAIAKIRAERTDPDDFVIFTTEQADRISGAILASCGLEMTSDVVVAEANVAKLARSVVESEKILQPFESKENT